MARYRTVGFVFVATLAILACGDGTGPRRIEGTYALRRVEGLAGPPFVVGDLSCAPGERIVNEITGDTIILTSTGTARRIRVYQTRIWHQGVEGTPLVASTDGSATYRREGNLVILTYPAFPQGPPAPVDTFRLSGMGFERESGLGGVCASGPTDLRSGKFEYARL
jgi:hypothetical protein